MGNFQLIDLLYTHFSLWAQQLRTHLAPHQHGSKDNLQAVKEVVPDDDDSGTQDLFKKYDKINQNAAKLMKAQQRSLLYWHWVLSSPLPLVFLSHVTSLHPPKGRGQARNTNQSDYTLSVLKHHPCLVCEGSGGALVLWHVAKRASV